MKIRDAVEADAGRLAALADPPTDVMRNLIHDRTVRVAEADDEDAAGVERVAANPTDDSNDGAGTSDDWTGVPGDRTGTPDDPGERGGPTSDRGEILGFVSFDVRDRTVHVTQMEGSADACERLLDEPIAFARTEEMDVEMLVPETEPNAGDAAEAAGFRNAGAGPRFEGTPTVRYRYDPAETGSTPGGIRDT